MSPSWLRTGEDGDGSPDRAGLTEATDDQGLQIDRLRGGAARPPRGERSDAHGERAGEPLIDPAPHRLQALQGAVEGRTGQLAPWPARRGRPGAAPRPELRG